MDHFRRLFPDPVLQLELEWMPNSAITCVHSKKVPRARKPVVKTLGRLKRPLAWATFLSLSSPRKVGETLHTRVEQFNAGKVAIVESQSVQ
jgi:hypothetical protein